MFCHLYYYNEIHDTVVRQTKGMEGMPLVPLRNQFCLFSSEPKQCKTSHLRHILLSEMQIASMQKNSYICEETDGQTDRQTL